MCLINLQLYTNSITFFCSEVKLATLLPSKQAAICLLTLAEDTKKAHLIRESKFCVRNLLNIYFDELISEHEDIITKAGLELVKPIVYIIF